MIEDDNYEAFISTYVRKDEEFLQQRLNNVCWHKHAT